MRNHLAAFALVSSLGLTLTLPYPGALAAQATSIKMFDEHGRERSSRVLPKSETDLFGLIRTFYQTVLDSLKLGKAFEEQLWRDLGIEPDSPQSQIIWKATFRTQAMFLDIPSIPPGTPDEKLQEVQLQSLQRQTQELRQIYVQMVRELKATGYPIEQVALYIDEKVRASVTVYVFGEVTEFGRKRTALEKQFEQDVLKDLAANGVAAEEWP